MHLRQIEIYMGLISISVTNQRLLNRYIFQECKFVGTNNDFLRLTRVFIQVVIGAHFMFVQYLINHFTALTTKVFVVRLYICVFAGFTTMVTEGFCMNMTSFMHDPLLCVDWLVLDINCFAQNESSVIHQFPSETFHSHKILSFVTNWGV